MKKQEDFATNGSVVSLQRELSDARERIAILEEWVRSAESIMLVLVRSSLTPDQISMLKRTPVIGPPKT